MKHNKFHARTPKLGPALLILTRRPFLTHRQQHCPLQPVYSNEEIIGCELELIQFCWWGCARCRGGGGCYWTLLITRISAHHVLTTLTLFAHHVGTWSPRLLTTLTFLITTLVLDHHVGLLTPPFSTSWSPRWSPRSTFDPPFSTSWSPRWSPRWTFVPPFFDKLITTLITTFDFRPASHLFQGFGSLVENDRGLWKTFIFLSFTPKIILKFIFNIWTGVEFLAEKLKSIEDRLPTRVIWRKTVKSMFHRIRVAWLVFAGQ